MRADQLSVGDLVPDAYLPHRFNKGPAEVRFVADDGEAHTFFAFRYPNGQHDSTTVLSESALEIWPAPAAPGLDYSRADDGETTQAIGVREPLHTGATTEGGLTPVYSDEAIGRPEDIGSKRRVGTSECGCPVRLAPEIRGDAGDTLVEHDDSICAERPF
jgi:hypothetical protein